MKLTPSESRKVIRATDAEPLMSVLDDACEVITLKIVLLIKNRRKAMREQRAKLPNGSAEYTALARKMEALGAIMVEISEAP